MNKANCNVHVHCLMIRKQCKFNILNVPNFFRKLFMFFNFEESNIIACFTM